MRKLEEEVEEKVLKLSVTENGKGRQEQNDCFVSLLGGRAASMQQRRRSDDGRQVST